MERGERGLRLERFPLVREGTGAEEPEEEVTPRAPPGARRLGVGGGLTSKSTFSPSGILGAVSLKERERERPVSRDKRGPARTVGLAPGGPPALPPWHAAEGAWPELGSHRTYAPLSPGRPDPFEKASASWRHSVLPDCGRRRGPFHSQLSRKGTLSSLSKQMPPRRQGCHCRSPGGGGTGPCGRERASSLCVSVASL